MRTLKRKTIVVSMILILIFSSVTSMLVINGESNNELRTEQQEELTNLENIDFKELTPETDQVKVTSLTLGELDSVNLANVDDTFELVFSQLDDEVCVYPSENYLYYRFRSDDKYIWGNIRLAPEERDSGLVHFAYYEYNKDLTGPDDANIRHELLGQEDGLEVEKVSKFCYILKYNDKKVIFNLHQIAQEPPQLFDLAPGEDMVFKTYDESGYQYFLIFNKISKSFYYILNEEESPIAEYEHISSDVIVDSVSKFVYYVDSEYQNRKILIGVYSTNVMQNSYYDGPFDQLADNYVDDECKLSNYIQLAYPYTKGQIDEYGNFKYDSGFRVAIMPYHIYENPSELVDIVEMAKTISSGSDFYSVIAYDFQAEMGSDLEFELEESTMITDDGEIITFDDPQYPPEPVVPENVDSASNQNIDAPESGTRGLLNWSYHSKLLSCLPWHIKNVTWKNSSSNYNWSKFHKTNITWCFHTKNVTYPWNHITNVTWPVHTRNATWSKFHIKNVTWWWHCKNVTYPWRHIRNATWPSHTRNATWSKFHIKNVTWRYHIKRITYPPRHISNVTWPKHNCSATWSKFHIKNVTWWPHCKNVTYPWRHERNVTWPVHTRNATWSKFHVKNVTWRIHIKCITYPPRHFKNATWPKHTRNATWSKYHVKNITWSKHIKCITYSPRHFKNATWPKHTRNATWSKFHLKNVTWPCHVKNVTYPRWHVRNVTWPRHKANVTWFKSHIKCITWRGHIKSVTYPYWHIRNVTWPKHRTNVTWSSMHIKGVTWCPHKKCITWTPHKRGFSWTYFYKNIFKRIINNRWMIKNNMVSICNEYNQSNNSQWRSLVKRYLKSKHS